MSAASESANIQTVRRYFDGCSSGDLDVLKSTLAEDVVHYFLPPRFTPIHGSEHLARHWRKFKRLLDPAWAIDRIIAQGDIVVSEWSCAFTPTGKAKRVMMRGTEWYVLRDGRIAEIRAYLQDDETMDTELVGFPYHDRGYLLLDRSRSN